MPCTLHPHLTDGSHVSSPTLAVSSCTVTVTATAAAANYCCWFVHMFCNSARYDALAVGCIPVVLSDDLLWAYSPATGELSESVTDLEPGSEGVRE